MSRRVSEYEHLLQQALQAKEDAQRRAQQAEEQQLQERRAREVAEERALRAEKTTFQDYLALCHTHFSKSLSIQSDRSRSTRGTVTAPQGRCYPNKIRPWDGFVEGQWRRFNEVYQYFDPPSGPPKLFPPSQVLEHMGKKLCDRSFASEDDLRPHQQLAVESSIGEIIAALSTMEGAREQFRLGRGVKFENHANTLDEEIEEVQERLQELSHGDDKAPGLIKADRICVYRDTEDKNTLSYLIEYKPAHKLPVTDLKRGLRCMNLHREVVLKYKIPTEKEKRQQYDADKKVGSVITQTFDYMIESGLEYSYVSTGKAFIFLWIKEHDPTTLFYHLTIPGEELQATDDPKTNVFHTAISQVLSFSLLAFTSERRDQDWRRTWKQKLPKWPANSAVVPPETPENRKMPQDPQGPQTTPTSEFKGKSPKEKRTFNLRARPSGRKCREDETPLYADSDDDSSSETESGDNRTPLPANRTALAPTALTDSPVASRTRGQTRSYCTQVCLLGLVRGGILDENCPNVEAHRVGRSHRRHGIGIRAFASSVRAQLGQTLDQDCEPLGKQGARGNLFKITLASYGYTFVGKGTIRVFVPDLQHEARVYGRLKRLQGMVVPVYLGSIGLIEPYIDLGVEIVHMLLMSWGGEMAESSDALDLSPEIRRSVDEIYREGVEHNDVRDPNILWNTERQRAMLIDFERSNLLDRPLQELSPNPKNKERKARQRKRPVQHSKYHTTSCVNYCCQLPLTGTTTVSLPWGQADD